MHTNKLNEVPKSPQLFIEYCNHLSINQLSLLQVSISADIMGININIKDDQEYNNHPDDPHWLHKSEVALEHYKWRLNTTKVIMETKVREQQIECDYDAEFVRAAEEILPPTMFDKVAIEVQERLQPYTNVAG